MQYPTVSYSHPLFVFAAQLLMFSYELQRRLRLKGAPVDVFAVHPGEQCELISCLGHGAASLH